jgi:hypothetical protein
MKVYKNHSQSVTHSIISTPINSGIDPGKTKNKLSSLLSVTTVLLVISLLFVSIVQAQMAPAPFLMQPLTWESKNHDGTKQKFNKPYLAESTVIEINKAPWLRVYFDQTNLGKFSYIVITSLADGAVQKLNANHLLRWQNSTAFFNGDAVKIDLYVSPQEENVFLRLKQVMIGREKTSTEKNAEKSICGGGDNRAASNNPAIGRIAPIGCTGWIASNGLHVTAGHCFPGANNNVLEFNVPASLANGVIQHPAPVDQYAIDPMCVDSISGGVGNDWGVFSVSDNPMSGLQPIAAQGASFTIVQDLAANPLRITGYGVDGPAPNFGNPPPRNADNQTQQTHTGNNTGSTGTTMRYSIDTQGGNSGSPIIDNNQNTISVGVHTHGGCSAGGGNNSGTSAFNANFWNALNMSCKADLWVRDTTSDTGLEPDPATVGQPMWQSPDIWVRNSQDGVYSHQNPEFGQTNYVYTRVRNRSTEKNASGDLELYYANASTGLSWDADWTHFGTMTIASLAPNAIQDISLPWSPPGTGHFCIVSRWSSPLEPMTFPETTSINNNTRNNNNIAWRNTTVVDLVELNDPVTVGVIVRNTSRLEDGIMLAFTVPEREIEKSFMKYGTVTIRIPKGIKYGRSTGIRWLDTNTFEILDPKKAAIFGIKMKARQEFKLKVEFALHTFPEKKSLLNFNIVQFDGKNNEVGGENYEIRIK